MQMSEQTVEGECPACGKTVRYTGYVPRIFLCLDCGGEEPHADGVHADDEGRLHYEEPDDEELVTDGGEEVGRATPQGRRLGPHYVPSIECGKCGTSHHYDAASGEYPGRCRECSAFLRRPTKAEHEQFTDFLVWNSLHHDRDADHGGEAVAE